MAVVRDGEIVTSFLAGSLLESTNIPITPTIRAANGSATLRRLALRTADTPWPTFSNHAFFSFATVNMRAIFCNAIPMRIKLFIHLHFHIQLLVRYLGSVSQRKNSLQSYSANFLSLLLNLQFKLDIFYLFFYLFCLYKK